MVEVLAFLSDTFNSIVDLLRSQTAFVVNGYHVSWLTIFIWFFMLDLLADFIVNFMSFPSGETVRAMAKGRYAYEEQATKVALQKRGLLSRKVE